AFRLGARLVAIIAAHSYIDAVNIRLTGVAFAGRHIFTLSILGGAIQARSRLGWASNIAIATKFRDPGHAPNPRTGFARGRFFTSKSRPQRCAPSCEAGGFVGPHPLAAALRALENFPDQFRNPAIWPVEGNWRRCHIAAIHALSWRDSY